MKDVDIGGFQRVNWDAKAAAAAAASAFLQLFVQMCFVWLLTSALDSTTQHDICNLPLLQPVILLINVAAINLSTI